MKAGKYSGKQGCNKGHRAKVYMPIIFQRIHFAYVCASTPIVGPLKGSCSIYN